MRLASSSTRSAKCLRKITSQCPSIGRDSELSTKYTILRPSFSSFFSGWETNQTAILAMPSLVLTVRLTRLVYKNWREKSGSISG